MTKMLKLATLSGVALAVLSTVAVAADLPSRKAPPAYIPPPPVFSWTGLYIGLNAGAIFNAYNNNNNNFFYGSNSQSNNKIGFIGGGQIGYNWQTGPVVFGLEADFNGHSNISSNNNAFGYGGGNSGSGFLGTGRGRIGYAFTPSFMVFGTGGVAYGNPWNQSNNNFAGFGGFAYGNNNQNSFRVGYTVGGGLEWMFAPNWSVKAEYLYVDLGRGDNNFSYLGFNNNAARSTAHVARLGVNYHFNWGGMMAPVVARY